MQSPFGRQQSVVRVKILTLAACTRTRPPTYLSASQDPHVTWVKCQAGTVPRIRYNACVFHTQYSLNTTLIYIKQKTKIRFSHPPNQTNKEISKHKSEVNNSGFNTLKTSYWGNSTCTFRADYKTLPQYCSNTWMVPIKSNQQPSQRDSNARKLSRSVMNYEILLDGSHSNLDMQRWKEGYPVGTLFLASAIYLDSQSQSRVKVEGPQWNLMGHEDWPATDVFIR